MPFTPPDAFRSWDRFIPESTKANLSPVDHLGYLMWADDLWRTGLADPNMVAGRASMDRATRVLRDARPSEPLAADVERAARLLKLSTQVTDPVLARGYAESAGVLEKASKGGPPERFRQQARSLLAGLSGGASAPPRNVMIRKAADPSVNPNGSVVQIGGTSYRVPPGHEAILTKMLRPRA